MSSENPLVGEMKKTLNLIDRSNVSWLNFKELTVGSESRLRGSELSFKKLIDSSRSKAEPGPRKSD
jgi:Ni,Fe-hydrogenase I small subunit